MSAGLPQCRTVTVHTFQGDRGALGRRVRKALDDEMNGLGPGPSSLECLLYAGHTGVSTDSDKAVYGFNPDLGNLPMWQGMQRLRNGDAFPGVVIDDTHVFAAATKNKLKVQTFDVLLPDPDFQDFERKLIAERKKAGTHTVSPTGMVNATAQRGSSVWLCPFSAGAWMNSPPCRDSAITRGADLANAYSEVHQ